ncbi:hypothetical protein KY345_06380 [Candidatus Woesearchaeota archaeon]|nr:hypothetical protein [Candidatus Woesearchaeota archaeon]
MNAVYNNRLQIRLDAEDKKELEEKGTLECRMTSWKEPKLILKLADEISINDGLEEYGFHIYSVPLFTDPKYRDVYASYISKERLRELTDPENPNTKGCYFTSKSAHGDVEFLYFGL